MDVRVAKTSKDQKVLSKTKSNLATTQSGIPSRVFDHRNSTQNILGLQKTLGNQKIQEIISKTTVDEKHQKQKATENSRFNNLSNSEKLKALKTEAKFRAMIKGARNKGWHIAAEVTSHFLEGKGKDFIIDSNWLKKQKGIQDALDRNLERFFVQVGKEIEFLKNGEEKIFTDYWDALVEGSAGSELYYASGDSTLTSTGHFILRKSENGNVSEDGTIIHTWKDRYDWHEGLLTIVPYLGKFYDGDANLLIKAGLAHEFDMYSSWKED